MLYSERERAELLARLYTHSGETIVDQLPGRLVEQPESDTERARDDTRNDPANYQVDGILPARTASAGALIVVATLSQTPPRHGDRSARNLVILRCLEKPARERGEGGGKGSELDGRCRRPRALHRSGTVPPTNHCPCDLDHRVFNAQTADITWPF